jgi:hypothetical protein
VISLHGRFRNFHLKTPSAVCNAGVRIAMTAERVGMGITGPIRRGRPGRCCTYNQMNGL